MAYENEITEITRSIWESMLSLPFESAEGSAGELQDTWVSVIHIAGEWEGAVAFECQNDLASQIAECMFGIPSGELSVQDRRDAVGEIINMIAGSLKAVMPAGSTISLPAVAEGKEYTLVVRGTREVSNVRFKTNNCPFGVRLLQREMAPKPTPVQVH